MTALVIVMIVLVIAAIVGAAIAVSALRAKETRQFALQHGLMFDVGGWEPPDQRDYELFRRGDTRRWKDVMTGTWRGRPITYCDYQYTERSVNSASGSTYMFSIVLMDLGCSIPQVAVKSRTLFGRLAEQTLGAPGIHFESTEFNERFNVHCADQRLALEVIDERMIQTLLACERGLSVDFGPNRILVWSKRHTVQQLPALLDQATSIAARVPDLVMREYGAPLAMLPPPSMAPPPPPPPLPETFPAAAPAAPPPPPPPS